MAAFVIATGLPPAVYYKTPLKQINAIRELLKERAEQQQREGNIIT